MQRYRELTSALSVLDNASFEIRERKAKIHRQINTLNQVIVAGNNDLVQIFMRSIIGYCPYEIHHARYSDGETYINFVTERSGLYVSKRGKRTKSKPVLCIELMCVNGPHKSPELEDDCPVIVFHSHSVSDLNIPHILLGVKQYVE